MSANPALSQQLLDALVAPRLSTGSRHGPDVLRHVHAASAAAQLTRAPQPPSQFTTRMRRACRRRGLTASRAAPLTCSPSSSISWIPRNSAHWPNRGTLAPAPADRCRRCSAGWLTWSAWRNRGLSGMILAFPARGVPELPLWPRAPGSRGLRWSRCFRVTTRYGPAFAPFRARGFGQRFGNVGQVALGTRAKGAAAGSSLAHRKCRSALPHLSPSTMVLRSEML
jgi:hypothetical protein